MDDSTPIPMTPLDCIVSDDRMQMLKTILPYLPANEAKTLAAMTKWQEFVHVLQMYPAPDDTLRAMSAQGKAPDTAGLLKDLELYGGSKGKELAQSVSQMMDMFQLIQLMQSQDMENKEDG